MPLKTNWDIIKSEWSKSPENWAAQDEICHGRFGGQSVLPPGNTCGPTMEKYASGMATFGPHTNKYHSLLDVTDIVYSKWWRS